MYIRKFTYSAEDVDCKLCTEYTRKIGCRHEVCPFLAERIEAGVVSYQSAIKAMIPRRSILWNRLSVLLQNYPGYLWADSNHKTRMELFNHQLGYNKSRNTPSYYAAMFLLTSNQALFNRTGNCFYRSGIEFGYATVLPHETELLAVVPGEDYCTLVTCVPYAVNSHRLLVRGERIPYEQAEELVEEITIEELPTSHWEEKYLEGIFYGVGAASIVSAAIIAFSVTRGSRRKSRGGKYVRK